MRTTKSALLVAISVTLCAADRSFADINTGLIAHWALDETTGVIAHDSAGLNNLTLGGYQPSDPSWVPGKIGGALRFSQVTNYALSDLPINMNQYTVSFWSKLNTRTGINPRIAGPQESGWIAAEFEHNVGIGMFGARDLTEPVPGAWEFYVITYDQPSGAAKTYKNGQLVRTGSNNLPPAINRWMFGHNGDPNNQNDSWNGLLDDIRIYGRQLSAGDAAELFAVPEPASIALVPLAVVLLSRRKRR